MGANPPPIFSCRLPVAPCPLKNRKGVASRTQKYHVNPSPVSTVENAKRSARSKEQDTHALTRKTARAHNTQ